MRHLFFVLFLVNILFAYWSSPENLGIASVDDINPQSCRMQILFYASQTCLVWQTDLNGNWDIFSRFGAYTWSDTFRITTNIASDINPSVAYDNARNCFWCVWQNNNAGNWDIYVSQGNISSGWSAPFQLTVDVLDDELASVYVNNDTVWVIWQDTLNILSTCYDGTWSAPIPVTNDSVISNIHPKINACHNHPFVVWERNGDIYYSEFLSGSWQTPQAITTDPYNDINPEISYANLYTEGVWVVWQSDRDGNYEIYTTAYDTLSVHYRLTSNDSADITPSPLFYAIPIRQYSAPPVTAFSTNRNGSYDIYTYFNYLCYDTIPVDTTPSEDILPVMTGCDDVYIWVLWQTDRNSDWDIYGSYIYYPGGIGESDNYYIKSKGNLTVSPNPFKQTTDIQMQDVRSMKQDFSLRIYDVSGRIVKSFNLISPASLREAGRAGVLPLASIMYWDGTDNSGFRLPAGVYFVRLENESEALTEKVVLVE